MRAWTCLLSLLLLLVFSCVCYGAVEVKAFEATFARGEGSPVTVVKSFPGVSGTATIEVVNGGLGDSAAEKVSASLISVNGQVIFDPASFNQNVTTLSHNVVLKEEGNSLEVTLRGKPGGVLAVRVTQQVEAEGAAVVGSAGGEVKVTDPASPIYGAKVVVPAGALPEGKVLTVKVADNLPAGTAQGIGQPLDFGPSGTTFTSPVTLVIPYNHKDAVAKWILSESRMRVYNYDRDRHFWIKVPDSSVDTVTHTVSVSVTHFSVYEINGDRLYDVNSVRDGVPADACPRYDASKNQILFIHGIQLDSADGYGNYTGNDNTFGNAQRYVIESGNNQVWHLSYDSWHDIMANSKTVSLAIDQIQKLVQDPSKKVTIIAHSEGGLLARSYLQAKSSYFGSDMRDNKGVAKLLLLGTPNAGSFWANVGADFKEKAGDALSEMSSDQTNLFLLLLNHPDRFPQVFGQMPQDVPVMNVYGTGIDDGDGIVSASHATLATIFPDNGNIRDYGLGGNLAHVISAVMGWQNGIADIISTPDYPCYDKDTCRHPSWSVMKAVVTDAERSKVALLVRNAASLDPDETSILKLLEQNNYNHTVIDPSAISADPSNLDNYRVLYMRTAAEPHAYKDPYVIEKINSWVENGGKLILEFNGSFLAHYMGIGTISTKWWDPCVYDAQYFIEPLAPSPLLKNVTNWSPPSSPDLDSQLISRLSVTQVGYGYPLLTFVSTPTTAKYDYLHVTYGWWGQPTNSFYCMAFPGLCTPERSIYSSGTGLHDIDGVTESVAVGAGMVIKLALGMMQAVPATNLVVGPVADKIRINAIDSRVSDF